MHIHRLAILEFESIIFSEIEVAQLMDTMNMKFKDLIDKHVTELKKYYHDSSKFSTDIELLHQAYLFNAYDALCYYNEYLSGLKHTDKDILAELLYTAELNICNDNTDRPLYIVGRAANVQILPSNANLRSWNTKSEKHNHYLDTISLPNNFETGLLVLKETRRAHMEQVIRQAHHLITRVRSFTFTEFDNQCLEDELSNYLFGYSNHEEDNCRAVIDKYALNKCDVPSINLELSLNTGVTKTMHELTSAIIKNKKLDKPYEKISVIEIIFEFIDKIIKNHSISEQREQSRTRIIRALSTHSKAVE